MKTFILIAALMLAAVPAYAEQALLVDAAFRNGTTNYIYNVEGYAEHSYQVSGRANTAAAGFQGYSGTLTAYGRMSPDQNWTQLFQVTASTIQGYFLYIGREIKYELIVRKNRASFTAYKNR